ncbi:HAD hydrolase [Pleurostoma richardsiae]|uniref:HAD hydrolase n=1 Tax=Pleurostoma richardsiae TaxID=41990 RepID=A0AA38RNC9_9PEZI|nr:HAD hydrolase [Pleurostoma richardsiae]
MKVPRRFVSPIETAQWLHVPRPVRTCLSPASGLAAGRSAPQRSLSHQRLPTSWTVTPRLSPHVGANAQLRRGFSTKKSQPSPGSASEGEAPSFAFAFDIDGVLLHVSEPIPGAKETLHYLSDHHIPFILLTNGGGRLEADRVADLSARLGVPLTTDNFVQSHTPFRQMTDTLADSPILVTGSDAARARAIAEAYGFRSVITSADVLAAQPSVYPFDPLLESVYASTARPLPAPLYRPGAGVPLEECLRVAAIFVFNDPRDWALDIQLVADLLLSHRGYLGTYSARNGDASLPNSGWQEDGQPGLHFSNADIFWSTGYHLPRFGQGAFQAAVAGVWRRVTEGQAELRSTSIGKPYRETYQFAERVLDTHRRAVLERSGKGKGKGLGQLKSVYMIGDNPESDIAGANMYESDAGTDWTSVLVRTGVWTPERNGGELKHRPEIIVDDVKQAVRWALEREGWKGQL